MLLKRLLLLASIAICLLPVHHATGFGFQAMFDWTDRYLPVDVPNYDQIGSPAFYMMVLIQQLDYFALPAFMLVTGFFLATFAASGNPRTVGWKTAFARSRAFFIPWLVWTAIFFLFFARRFPAGLDDLFDRYYYVVLVIAYSLSAPILIPIARDRWKPLLASCAAIEVAIFTLRYLRTFDVEIPVFHAWFEFWPRWLPPTFLLWVVMGMVVGFHQQEFLALVRRYKWFLAGGAIVFAALTMVEYLIVAQITGSAWLGPYWGGIARLIYTPFVLTAFFAFDQIRIPFTETITSLGGKTLGIYLVHSRVMHLVAILMYRLTPDVLGNQLLYQSILIVSGMGGALLIMELVRRSPVRKYHRYLFG